MFRNMRSVSAPELYVRESETETRAANVNQPSSVYSYSSGIESSIDQNRRQTDESEKQKQDRDRYNERDTSRRLFSHRPSRLEFLCYAYVLLGGQIFLSMLHWLGATYRWKPYFNVAERSLYVLLLLLTWLNLTLGFLGFRRLQITFPINWIIFVCMFESLTLLVMCLCMRELDLTWHFIVVAMAVLLVYTPLGLWLPPTLTGNLYILILISISVVVLTLLALAAGLSMHIYVPLTACIACFGPWTMYNTFKLFEASWNMRQRNSYLKFAARMYMTYGLTVGGLIIVNRIANEFIETENCKAPIFCQKRSPSITYGPGN